MAFYEIINSTTAFADDVNENFYHLAQGTIEPKANTGTMGITTGVYDLGASATAWKTCYCENVYANTTTLANTIWKKIFHTQITTGANEIIVTGLDGDSSIDYYIVFNATLSASSGLGSIGAAQPFMTINNTASSSFYYSGILSYLPTTVQTAVIEPETYIRMGGNYSGLFDVQALNVFMDIHMNAKTGAYRVLDIRAGTGETASLTIYDLRRQTVLWLYTDATVTSFIFDAATSAHEWKYGEISIYAKVGV